MADDSYTHVKFYMDFETEEWDILCKREKLEAEAEMTYDCEEP
jgi:hypothetical protein